MSGHDYDKLMDHDYDGIREYDNPLPGWWTWIFVLSVVFSILYVAWYHIGPGPSVEEAYETQVAAYFEEQLERLGITQADDPTIIRLMQDKDMMAALAGMFQGNCGQCHRADGGGDIGPNLCDESYKNVQTPMDIFTVITDGVDGSAMTGWERRLREPQRILLAAYVASLRGTTPANPKAGEGSPIPPWPSLEDVTPPAEGAADTGNGDT